MLSQNESLRDELKDSDRLTSKLRDRIEELEAALKPIELGESEIPDGVLAAITVLGYAVIKYPRKEMRGCADWVINTATRRTDFTWKPIPGPKQDTGLGRSE